MYYSGPSKALMILPPFMSQLAKRYILRRLRLLPHSRHQVIILSRALRSFLCGRVLFDLVVLGRSGVLAAAGRILAGLVLQRRIQQGGFRIVGKWRRIPSDRACLFARSVVRGGVQGHSGKVRGFFFFSDSFAAITRSSDDQTWRLQFIWEFANSTLRCGRETEDRPQGMSNLV
jgi:hypothetical protein